MSESREIASTADFHSTRPRMCGVWMSHFKMLGSKKGMPKTQNFQACQWFCSNCGCPSFAVPTLRVFSKGSIGRSFYKGQSCCKLFLLKNRGELGSSWVYHTIRFWILQYITLWLRQNIENPVEIVNFPSRNGDVPCKCLPEGTNIVVIVRHSQACPKARLKSSSSEVLSLWPDDSHRGKHQFRWWRSNLGLFGLIQSQ